MQAGDKVRFSGRKATVVAVREDGTVSLLMADTGRMLRVPAAKAAGIAPGW